MVKSLDEIKEGFRELMGSLSIEEIVTNTELRKQLEGFNAALEA